MSVRHLCNLTIMLLRNLCSLMMELLHLCSQSLELLLLRFLI